MAGLITGGALTPGILPKAIFCPVLFPPCKAPERIRFKRLDPSPAKARRKLEPPISTFPVDSVVVPPVRWEVVCKGPRPAKLRPVCNKGNVWLNRVSLSKIGNWVKKSVISRLRESSTSVKVEPAAPEFKAPLRARLEEMVSIALPERSLIRPKKAAWAFSENSGAWAS